MSNRIILSLHTLPIELVYRILDNLIPLDILLSVYNVCTRLDFIIDTYHRYKTFTKLHVNYPHEEKFTPERILHILANNRTLTTLCLVGNKIGSEGAQYLAKALQKNVVSNNENFVFD
ncbi:unnamed protein product [Rotaria sp. Silwood2]|nr:unnamed protein product [Rotaria sp. Silwood2]CAF4547235.1 unnamed protein product [Rotaria sp. Silwood2]